MPRNHRNDNKTAQVIAITSGKGGVGKTSLTVNLGIALSQLGHKVCLFDADANLANLNIMLRLMPEYTLEHVLRGERDIQDIVLHKSGVSLVPGATGLTDFVRLSGAMQSRAVHSLASLENYYDHLLVDTSAGISEQVLSFIEAAHQCLLVISPEPTSLTDAFSLLRVLKKRGYQRAVNVVVNYAATELGARKVFNRFSGAVAKYIGYKVRYLGYVLKDEHMTSAITLQNPIILQNPESLASRSLIRLAGNINRLTRNDYHEESLSEQLMQLAQIEPQQLASAQRRLPMPETPAGDADTVLETEMVYESEDDTPPLNRRQILNSHNRALREFIEDPDTSKLELRSVLNDLIDVYVSRFNDYPFDAVGIVNRALELERLSADKLGQLMMTLQLFYQDQLSQTDRDTSAEHVRQLINSYVQEHKVYPFDVVQTLYQFLDLESVSQNQMRQLLTNLLLVYEDKYRVIKDADDSRPDLYCAEHEQEQYEKVVALLQDKHLHNLALKMKPEQARNDHNNDAPVDKPEQKNQNPLLDSIRFASLTD